MEMSKYTLLYCKRMHVLKCVEELLKDVGSCGWVVVPGAAV